MPVALFCNKATLAVVSAFTPLTSVIISLLNPDASLNEFGTTLLWKLKFTASINPLVAKRLLVVYPKVIPSHPLGQQFVCTCDNALYKSHSVLN